MDDRKTIDKLISRTEMSIASLKDKVNFMEQDESSVANGRRRVDMNHEDQRYCFDVGTLIHESNRLIVNLRHELQKVKSNYEVTTRFRRNLLDLELWDLALGYSFSGFSWSREDLSEQKTYS